MREFKIGEIVTVRHVYDGSICGVVRKVGRKYIYVTFGGIRAITKKFSMENGYLCNKDGTQTDREILL